MDAKRDVWVSRAIVLGATAAVGTGAMSVLAALAALAVVLAATGAQTRGRFGGRDTLTGLVERGRFCLEVRAAMRAGDTAVAVVGLDRFSNVNSALGRAAGNDVLREVAARLERVASAAARLGGDEFAVLATGPDAESVGNLVSAALAAPVCAAGRTVFLGASVGVAFGGDSAADADDVVQQADTAMQLAKERGGGAVLPYSSELRTEMEDRLAVASALQGALERGELVLHYQPIVDTKTLAIVAVEALVRWEHPTLGLIPPDRFIPIAEDTGLIVPLGEWVLEEACRQAKEWQQYAPLRVAVNVSARQFEHQRMDDVVARALRLSGLDPELLDLELTERAELHDTDDVADALEAVRSLGVGCSVDDFGTGYGGLSYLVRLPVDELKIDRSFVNEIDESTDQTAIVAGVISLAHRLGLRVVAEGVETASQARFLVEHGCHEFQGFLVSKPVPAERFVELLAPDRALGAPSPIAEARRPVAAGTGHVALAEHLWRTTWSEPEPAKVATHPSLVRSALRHERTRRHPFVAAAVGVAVLVSAGSAAAAPAATDRFVIAAISAVDHVLPGEFAPSDRGEGGIEDGVTGDAAGDAVTDSPSTAASGADADRRSSKGTASSGATSGTSIGSDAAHGQGAANSARDEAPGRTDASPSDGAGPPGQSGTTPEPRNSSAAIGPNAHDIVRAGDAAAARGANRTTRPECGGRGRRRHHAVARFYPLPEMVCSGLPERPSQE